MEKDEFDVEACLKDTNIICHSCKEQNSGAIRFWYLFSGYKGHLEYKSIRVEKKDFEIKACNTPKMGRCQESCDGEVQPVVPEGKEQQ